MKKKFPFLILSALSLNGCKFIKNLSASNEFETTQNQKEEMLNLKIKELSGINFNVKKTFVKYINDFDKESENYNLHIHFPKLTEVQKIHLEKLFKSAPVPQKTSYSLTDFLPPFVQKTLEKRFLIERPWDETLPQPAELPSTLSAQANCWGTTYEFLRNGSSGFYVFLVDAPQIQSVLENAKYSRIVPESAAQFGDALFVYKKDFEGQTYLAHTAIYIAEGIFFEKPTSDENTIYRIGLKSDLEKTYATATFEYRRFDKETLPNPHEQFRVSTAYPQVAKQLDENKANNLALVVSKEENGEPYYTFTPIRFYPYQK